MINEDLKYDSLKIKKMSKKSKILPQNENLIQKRFLRESFYSSSLNGEIYEIKIEIGGICTSIKTSNIRLAKIIEKELDIFLSQKKPSLFIEIQVKKDIPGELNSVIQGKKILLAGTRFFGGMIEDEGSKAKLILTDIDTSSIRDFLHIFYSYFLPQFKGIFLHACSIINSQKGFVFCGESGSGKTTIAQLSKKYTILTDEMSLVRELNGKFRVFSTPYWGDRGMIGEEIQHHNVSAEIEGIFFLKKDKEVYLKSIPYFQATTEIMENIIPFLTELSFKKDKNLFYLCSKLARQIPCYELHFLPDVSFWKFISEDDNTVFKIR